MEWNVNRENVRINETVYEGFAEEVLECDIRLPDYCPDIARILKTDITPRVANKYINGDKAVVEGTAQVRILYVPEEGQTVRSMMYLQNFSRPIDMRNSPGDVFIDVKPNISYQNCRVLSPRKLEVKASMGLQVKVTAVANKEMISSAEGGGVELLMQPIPVSQTVGIAEKNFKVAEMLELGAGKPPVASIVKYDAMVIPQDVKVISNKVITKGEAVIKIAYVSELGMNNLEMMEYNLPVSQILDLEGVDDSCTCNVGMEVAGLSVDTGSDSDGQNKSFEVELEINAVAKAMRETAVQTVADAYSTAYELKLEKNLLSFDKQIESVKANNMVRESIELGSDEVSNIIDMSGNIRTLAVTNEPQAVNVEARLTVSMIVADPEGRINCIDREVPVMLRHEMKMDYGPVSANVDLKLLSVSYSMSGTDRVDIRADILMDTGISIATYENVITNIEVLEDNPKEKAKRKALTLYFADKGEKVWDIAKRYNTSMQAVKSENALDTDELADHCMLLIPSVQNMIL